MPARAGALPVQGAVAPENTEMLVRIKVSIRVVVKRIRLSIVVRLTA